MLIDFKRLEVDLFENGFLSALAISAIIALLAYVLIKLINNAVNRLSGHSRFNAAALIYFRRILAALIVIMALFGIFMQVRPLQKVAMSALASSGVLVVIIGFAAQQAMANIVGGFFISIFKPFSINDRIKLPEKDIVGFVEDISLRHTVIRTFENNRVIVPNSVMNTAIIENAYYQDGKVCRFLDISISLSADIDSAMAIMAREARAHHNFIDNRTEGEKASGTPDVPVRLVSLDGTAAMLRAAVWAKDAGTGYEMMCDLLLSIKKSFDAEGIKFPLQLCHKTF